MSHSGDSVLNISFCIIKPLQMLSLTSLPSILSSYSSIVKRLLPYRKSNLFSVRTFELFNYPSHHHYIRKIQIISIIILQYFRKKDKRNLWISLSKHILIPISIRDIMKSPSEKRYKSDLFLRTYSIFLIIIDITEKRDKNSANGKIYSQIIRYSHSMDWGELIYEL